jgi:hypothetical protein
MTGPTYFDRLTGEDTRTVEELCRPLSAKVLPRIAMIAISHEITPQQAIANQRRVMPNPAKSQSKRGTYGKKVKK